MYHADLYYSKTNLHKYKFMPKIRQVIIEYNIYFLPLQYCQYLVNLKFM
jgi:hypothetical protein